jgi:hypothetical protein
MVQGRMMFRGARSAVGNGLVLPFVTDKMVSGHTSEGRAVRRDAGLRVCVSCGGYFPARRSDALRCSPRCRKRAQRSRGRLEKLNPPLPSGADHGEGELAGEDRFGA